VTEINSTQIGGDAPASTPVTTKTKRTTPSKKKTATKSSKKKKVKSGRTKSKKKDPADTKPKLDKCPHCDYDTFRNADTRQRHIDRVHKKAKE
jgi:hypothetical protein